MGERGAFRKLGARAASWGLVEPRLTLVPDDVDEDPLGGLPVWRDLEVFVAREVGGMLGVSLEVTPLRAAPDLHLAAAVSLSAADLQVTASVGAGVERQFRQALCEALLGEPAPDAVVADVLGELANTGGGLFRRLVAPAALSFGMTTPRPVEAPSPGARVWRLSGGEVTLVLWAFARHDPAVWVPVRALRAGMMVTRDVVAGDVPLAKRGTVLTDHTVARMVRHLGPGVMVRVVQ